MDADLNIAELVSELTLEEKASLCLGSDFWHTTGIDRLGIPPVMVTDGPHGLRKQPDGLGAGLVVGPRPRPPRRGGGWPRGA